MHARTQLNTGHNLEPRSFLPVTEKWKLVPQRSALAPGVASRSQACVCASQFITVLQGF